MSPGSALPHGIGKIIFSNLISGLPGSSSGRFFSYRVKLDMWVCLISGQLKNMQRTRGPTDMTLSSWSRICICHLQKCQCFNRGQVSQEKRECVHWIWQKDRKVSFKRVQTKEYEWEQGDNSENVCVSFVLYLASSHLTRPYGYIHNRSKVWYKDLLNVLKRGLICSPRLSLFSYLKTEIFWILLLDSCFSLDSNAFFVLFTFKQVPFNHGFDTAAYRNSPRQGSHKIWTSLHLQTLTNGIELCVLTRVISCRKAVRHQDEWHWNIVVGIGTHR